MPSAHCCKKSAGLSDWISQYRAEGVLRGGASERIEVDLVVGAGSVQIPLRCISPKPSEGSKLLREWTVMHNLDDIVLRNREHRNVVE